jgi:hypothetical protein
MLEKMYSNEISNVPESDSVESRVSSLEEKISSVDQHKLDQL